MKKYFKIFTVLFLISQTTACAENAVLTKPSSRDQAAAVLISVSAVAPWDQIADAVQPNFSLTSAEALKEIAPVTARIQEQVLKSFGFGLGLGWGTGTQAPTPKPDAPEVGKTPNTLPCGDVGLDPILKYQAALSLYQAVQLMNREVEYVTERESFVPYLVTMKLAVMPYRHNLPYDVHARISFFPGCDDEGSPNVPIKNLSQGITGSGSQNNHNSPNFPILQGPMPENVSISESSKNNCTDKQLPQIVPILVTDDIERAMKSSAVEVAKQIGFALGMMVQGVGANIGANKEDQSIKGIIGQDINSRLTVSRLSDNTIYVRIGASTGSPTGPELIGQTYNIALLLLVPKEHVDSKKPFIQVFQHNELQDAIDGTILPDRPTSALVHHADQVMRSAIGGKHDDILKEWTTSDDKNKEMIVRSIAGPIQTSEFPKFMKMLENTENMKGRLNELPLDYKKNLWTRLTAILADSPFKSAFFELPKSQPITFVAQTPLLFDDTKEKAQVKLQTISGAKSRTLTAVLKVNTKGKSVEAKEFDLVADTISLDTNNGVMTFTFPSPAKWGLEKSTFNNSELIIGQRCLTPDSNCPEIKGPKIFKLHYSAAKEDTESASSKTDASANINVSKPNAKPDTSAN